MATAAYIRGLIGSLPPMHELAKQAGISLPGVLGNIEEAARGQGDGKDGAPAANSADAAPGKE